jgi:SAM-dependent methyltransferase
LSSTSQVLRGSSLTSLPPLSLNAWLRWDVVQRVLDEFDDLTSVLEIGTGLGALSARLALRYEYVGVERDPMSFAVARERLARVRRGTILLGDHSALETNQLFDLVCAFEVLEHIEDDVGALWAWAAKLRDGGSVLLSVPAWRRRWGASDSAAGHIRRYDREDLEAVLAQAGLEDIRVQTYGFPLGYALHAVWDVLARRRPQKPIDERTAQSGRWLQPSDARAPITQWVSLPFRFAQRPFAATDLGTGFVATARKCH